MHNIIVPTICFLRLFITQADMLYKQTRTTHSRFAAPHNARELHTHPTFILHICLHYLRPWQLLVSARPPYHGASDVTRRDRPRAGVRRRDDTSVMAYRLAAANTSMALTSCGNSALLRPRAAPVSLPQPPQEEEEGGRHRIYAA